MKEMSEEARAAARAYKKAWRERNRDKVRASTIRYWEKKAAQYSESSTPNDCTTK